MQYDILPIIKSSASPYQINIINSLPQSFTQKRLAFRRYVRCLWINLHVPHGFVNQNFIRNHFLIVAVVKTPVSIRGYRILSDFRELSFCGPCGPCFEIYLSFDVMIRVSFHNLLPHFLNLTSGRVEITTISLIFPFQKDFRCLWKRYHKFRGRIRQ